MAGTVYSGAFHNRPSEKRTPMLQCTLAVLRIENAIAVIQFSNLREADASGFQTADKILVLNGTPLYIFASKQWTLGSQIAVVLVQWRALMYIIIAKPHARTLNNTLNYIYMYLGMYCRHQRTRRRSYVYWPDN